MEWWQYMQVDYIKKIVLFLLVLLVLGILVVLFWLIINQSNIGQEVQYNSGNDPISGSDYSNTPTGGDRGDVLSILGLINLENKGMNYDDIELVKQYTSYILINKYSKSIDDTVSISKDNLDFIVGTDAVNTTYSFRVYLDRENYITGEFATQLKTNPGKKTISFYNSNQELIKIFNI